MKTTTTFNWRSLTKIYTWILSHMLYFKLGCKGVSHLTSFWDPGYHTLGYIPTATTQHCYFLSFLCWGFMLGFTHNTFNFQPISYLWCCYSVRWANYCHTEHRSCQDLSVLRLPRSSRLHRTATPAREGSWPYGWTEPLSVWTEQRDQAQNHSTAQSQGIIHMA